MSVCQGVCVLPADFYAGCCLMSSGVFERLVEVKLLSTPGQRECTDERPLHHPNGIHKPLNQHCCLGLGWVNPVRDGERRSSEPHTPRNTLKMYTSAQVRKMYSVNKTTLLGVSCRGGAVTQGRPRVCGRFNGPKPLGSGTEC